MTEPRVPFNVPFFGSEEADAAAAVIRSGHVHGNGPTTLRVECLLRDSLAIRHALLTTSCTHALEMAMLALGIGAGDEVILPSFTFPSTANAVVLRGARPVFAEIQPGTLNVDPGDIEKKVTPRTRAVIVVHAAGVACAMEEIQAITAAHGIRLVEDAAQGIDAFYRGIPLGTLGDIGCLSFHGTKNITSGEGGAFLTNHDDLGRAGELLREKGTNRAAFVRGEIDKYGWVAEGSSYVPSDILAAVLEVQLARRAEIKERREAVWKGYYRALEPLEAEGVIRLPEIPSYAASNYHIFFLRTQTTDQRDSILEKLAQAGVQATFHYTPLHTSPLGRSFAGDEPLPVTERCADTLIRLPVYPSISGEIEEIAETVSRVIRECV